MKPLMIAYSRADGGVNVVYGAPIEDLRKLFPDLTDEGYKRLVWERSVPSDAIAPREVSIEDVPADRTFRDAWRPDFSIDMEKAFGIARDRLRAERQPVLDELDRQWNQATGGGNTKDAAAIEAQRQVLRDMPASPSIADSKNPDALKTAVEALSNSIASAKNAAKNTKK